MTPARLALLAGALALIVPAAGFSAESPFDPFRRLMQKPSETMREVMGKRRAHAPAKATTPEAEAAPTTGEAAPEAKAADPAPAAAAEPAPAAEAPPATVATETLVPTPRARPAFSPDLAARFDDATNPAPPTFAAEEKGAAEATDPAAIAAEAERKAAAPLALAEPEPTTDPPPDIIIPHPEPRPDFSFADTPPAKKGRATGKLASLSPDAGELTSKTCMRTLESLGIEASPLAPIHEGSCGVAAPAAVASIENGSVDFSEKAIVNCATASALASWMEDDVQPEAQKQLGGRVTGLRIAASYICRGRNNIPGAQLSEHAFGNAIDISAFKIAGVGWVEVGNTKGAAQASFLRAIRKDACGPFTTVLGPGVAYHDSHFHLDLAKRRTAGPSKGLYCR